MPTAQFRKTVVAPGTYHTPEGRIDITPERIRRWSDSFRAMRASGIKIPIPWGHQSLANPVEPSTQDEHNFLRSRYNASYVSDLEIHPQTGELVMVANPPPGYRVDLATGALVNDRDGSQIAEVSAAVCDWRDGSGRTWKDTIRHIALTPLPVAHGTPGFTTDDRPAGEVRLSLAACVHRFALATNGALMDKPPNNAVADPPPEKPKADIVDFASPKPDSGDGGDLVMQNVTLLEEAGVHLPEGTTAANFQQHLHAALVALKGKHGAATPPEEPKPTTPPPGPLTAESPPLMMSLDRIKDPLALRMAKRLQGDDQQRRLRQVETLAKLADGNGLPYLRPADVLALRGEAAKAQFALTVDGASVETEIDRKLSLLERTLRGQSMDTDLKEEVPPEGQRREDQKKEIAERAARVSRA